MVILSLPSTVSHFKCVSTLNSNGFGLVVFRSLAEKYHSECDLNRFVLLYSYRCGHHSSFQLRMSFTMPSLCLALSSLM